MLSSALGLQLYLVFCGGIPTLLLSLACRAHARLVPFTLYGSQLRSWLFTALHIPASHSTALPTSHRLFSSAIQSWETDSDSSITLQRFSTLASLVAHGDFKALKRSIPGRISLRILSVLAPPSESRQKVHLLVTWSILQREGNSYSSFIPHICFVITIPAWDLRMQLYHLTSSFTAFLCGRSRKSPSWVLSGVLASQVICGTLKSSTMRNKEWARFTSLKA